MLISKEKFIYYLNKYKEAYEEENRFHEALRPFFDFPVCTYMSGLMSSYENLLGVVSECEECEDGIFSWWLNPREDKTIIVQDTKSGAKINYNVETSAGLYKYLYDMYHHDNGKDT